MNELQNLEVKCEPQSNPGVKCELQNPQLSARHGGRSSSRNGHGSRIPPVKLWSIVAPTSRRPSFHLLLRHRNSEVKWMASERSAAPHIDPIATHKDGNIASSLAGYPCLHRSEGCAWADCAYPSAARLREWGGRISLAPYSRMSLRAPVLPLDRLRPSHAPD